MRRCGQCGEVLRRNDAFCPTCLNPAEPTRHSKGAPPSAGSAGDDHDSDTTPLVAIARFRNAAEAGYFAHELLHQFEIPAAVMLDDTFDALSGYWSTRYVLAVPDDLAETAASQLQGLVEDSEGDELPDDFSAAERLQRGVSERLHGNDAPGELDDREQYAPVEQSGVNWVPIVLTLAAGSVVFWGLRTWQAQNQPKAAAAGDGHQLDLWDRLSTPQKPWVQELDNGVGRRELLFDPRRKEAILREDRDGDGRFETELTVGGLKPER